MHFIAKCCTLVHVSDVAPEENRVCSLATRAHNRVARSYALLSQVKPFLYLGGDFVKRAKKPSKLLCVPRA